MKTSNILLLGLLIQLTSACTCGSRERPLSSAERDQIRPFVSNQAPSTPPTHSVGGNFNGKVELVGFDVSPETVVPGQNFTVTWYWHVTEAPGSGWNIFTHLGSGAEPSAGDAAQNRDGGSLIRDLYQPGRWRRGEYIRDVQEIALPPDWAEPRVALYVGLWKGDDRMPVEAGRSDGGDRVFAGVVPVDVSRAVAPEQLTLEASLRGEIAINLDGVLDEPVWQTAQSTGRFVLPNNPGAREPAPFRAETKVLFDAENLYVAFDVADVFLTNPVTARDGRLWEHDAVEIMIDPEGDNQHYFEIQVSPTGNIFDTHYDARRQPFNEAEELFGHKDWSPTGLRAAVHRQGTANDREPDVGYTVEIIIPWSALSYANYRVEPPTSDATWRMNFYVMNQLEEGMQWGAWSAPGGDFHTASNFGRVHFGAPVAAAPAGSVPAVAAEVAQAQPAAGSADPVPSVQPPQQAEVPVLNPMHRRLLENVRDRRLAAERR